MKNICCNCKYKERRYRPKGLCKLQGVKTRRNDTCDKFVQKRKYVSKPKEKCDHQRTSCTTNGNIICQDCCDIKYNRVIKHFEKCNHQDSWFTSLGKKLEILYCPTCDSTFTKETCQHCNGHGCFYHKIEKTTP